jgi:predicted RNase H-like HicB family nuclease
LPVAAETVVPKPCCSVLKLTHLLTDSAAMELHRKYMNDRRNKVQFTGALFREGRRVVSLCLELDVASQGKTSREARKMLAEAVALYLEGCFESNIPYLRPVPRDEDPRFEPPDNFLGIFPLKIDFQVRAVA